MKNKSDHFIRSIEDDTWKQIKILSIQLEVPIGQLIKILLESYNETKNNEAA